MYVCVGACPNGRLIRGDGEVIEKIVSRGQQQHINATATYMDGLSFLRGAVLKK